MSEYVHEIVLQDYIIENIASFQLFVQYKHSSRLKLMNAVFNPGKTFWDLEGTLESGDIIPVEVEWSTRNFVSHKHQSDPDFKKLISENGVLLVLRKTKELPGVQQISIFDSVSESQFKKEFKAWFKKKSSEYIDRTLNPYSVGSYKREIPRVILYPLSRGARENYFLDGSLYRKDDTSPALIGFKSAAYEKNMFIRDLQPNDIILFIASDGTRSKRAEFVSKVKAGKMNLHRLAAYKITSGLYKKDAAGEAASTVYWPDEIKKQQLIYPYICTVEDEPFILRTETAFPFIPFYSDSIWEAFRSCIQYGEYREISPLDFTILISNL
jgi:hypothetical protein